MPQKIVTAFVVQGKDELAMKLWPNGKNAIWILYNKNSYHSFFSPSDLRWNRNKNYFYDFNRMRKEQARAGK